MCHMVTSLKPDLCAGRHEQGLDLVGPGEEECGAAMLKSGGGAQVKLREMIKALGLFVWYSS